MARVTERRGPSGKRRPAGSRPAGSAGSRRRLWLALAAAAAAVLLLLWTTGGAGEKAPEGGTARTGPAADRVERRGARGFELVQTSWDSSEEPPPPEPGPYLDPDELQRLNEARERWQNLDVAVQKK